MEKKSKIHDLWKKKSKKTKRRGFPGVAMVNKVSPVSLGYPLSVFNKNSTLKLFLAPPLSLPGHKRRPPLEYVVVFRVL